MTVSDYIIDFFVRKGIKDFFGYQGTMIAYFVDAIHRNPNANNHSCYNEQGASFAACGYAQAGKKCGVAYSTSGPGAVNLLSGVANAYFDSEPTIFITGQLNTYEYTGIPEMRQQGFQEINIVEMAKPITKYAVQITDAKDTRYELEKAWYLANNGRKGSVLIDLPMNIQRTEFNADEQQKFTPSINETQKIEYQQIYDALSKSKRPVIIVGNGVCDRYQSKLKAFIKINNIPTITTLLASSFLSEDELHLGNMGSSYGNRTALMAVHKADLLISIGASLGKKQTGVKLENFAPNAQLIRIDIDETQLKAKIKKGELQIKADTSNFIEGLTINKYTQDIEEWVDFIHSVKAYYTNFDKNLPELYPNHYIESISDLLPDGYNVVSDVGQHMMWVAQSFHLKKDQLMLFSGGHGAMGYALPAAIGAYYANRKPSIAISGDGAFQMNIQELQWVVREKLPIKIVVMNNHCLGMIRSVQEDYIDSRYEGVSEESNFSPCRFKEIAQAYGIESKRITFIDELDNITFDSQSAFLLEIDMDNKTLALPKTFFGDPVYRQRPYIPDADLQKMLDF